MFARLRRNDKGFTLVELMMVVVVLGILAGVAVPMMGSIRTKAEASKVKSLVDTVATAVSLEATDKGKAPADAAAVTPLVQLPTDASVAALTADFSKTTALDTTVTMTCAEGSYCVGYAKKDATTNLVRVAGFKGGTTPTLVAGTYREISLAF